MMEKDEVMLQSEKSVLLGDRTLECQSNKFYHFVDFSYSILTPKSCIFNI